MNLVLDIGNTTVKGYVFDGFEIVESVVCEDINDDQIARLVKKYKPKQAIVSSTRGNVELPEVVSKIEKVVRFNINTPIPIKNHYQSSTLGMDRLAGVVEANAQFPDKDVIVIDMGTAITIDFVSPNGYLGGNISPGMEMRFKALNSFTSSLPLCSASSEVTSWGTTTNDAIMNGVVMGIMYEIEKYIEKNQSKIVIFTGGDAKYFAKQLKITIFADYELVPKGLNRILVYNEQEK